MEHKCLVNRRAFMRALTAIGGVAAVPGLAAAETDARPLLMLAETYTEDVEVSSYLVSEKYDGVRAYWDGHALFTRAGNIIRSPSWFTRQYPATPLDGELWIGRERFEELISIVRDREPDPSAWSKVRFMVFDLPQHSGPFLTRLQALHDVAKTIDPATIHVVPQWRVPDHKTLRLQLDSMSREGAEGLMLKRDQAPYHSGRSNDLLKLKLYHDAEAQVIGHVPGRGKHSGKLGAVEVRRADGITFRIGTGFTDAQRDTPPPIGTWVTYRYLGTTANGVPRFASFLRVRD